MTGSLRSSYNEAFCNTRRCHCSCNHFESRIRTTPKTVGAAFTLSIAQKIHFAIKNKYGQRVSTKCKNLLHSWFLRHTDIEINRKSVK